MPHITTNTLAPHKPSRKWTWYSPDGKYNNQTDTVLRRNPFQTGVNIARTRSFPRADIGINHYYVMMTFQLCLNKLEFLAMIEERFDLLIILGAEDIMISTIHPPMP